MNAASKLASLKGAIVLAAVLAMSGSALAKKPASGVPGQLSADRTSVEVTIGVLCDPATTLNVTGQLSVHILQSVGRLINVGIANADVTCTGSETDEVVTVEAIDGLTFQPGPATMIFRFTTQDSVTLAPTVQERGSRLNLRP